MEEKSIGRELRLLNNLIMRCVDSSSVKKQVDSITGTNGWIIGYIARHSEQDIYQRDLEKHFGITRSTASKVISLMERKGLIRRESVAHDARLKKLVLTQRAMDISEMMAKDAMQFEKNLTKGFTTEELDLLLNYIQRMKNNIK